MATSSTSSPESAGRLAPHAIGPLIAAIFGFVFVVANSGDLPGRWQAVARVGGALVFVALLAGIARGRRTQAALPSTSGRPIFGRGYWAIVAAEAVALLVGLFVINFVVRAHGLAVAWIAFVVGVHFFGLGTLWRAGVYYVLGVVLTVLGLAGFALHAAGASSAVVALVSGIASGVALDLSVARWVYSAISSGGLTR